MGSVVVVLSCFSSSAVTNRKAAFGPSPIFARSNETCGSSMLRAIEPFTFGL
jgi:hypothetical protein